MVVDTGPSTSTIRVRIPLTPTVFSVKFVFEKNENKQKEAGVGPFLKNKQKPEELSVPLMLLEIEKSMMHFATQIHTNTEIGCSTYNDKSRDTNRKETERKCTSENRRIW